MADSNNPVKVEKYDEPQVKQKEKSLIVAVIVTLVVVAGLALVGFLFMRPEPDTVQGQAEAVEIRISGKLPGRVTQIFVEEGQHVKAGDTLVHIVSTIADAKLAQAEAMTNVARAANQKVDAGTRSQIVQGAADLVRQAQAAVTIAKKTYDRMENLYKEGVISEQKRDEAKAAYDAATAGEAAAKSQYELAKAGAQREDKEAAQAMVKAAQGSVKEVDAVLEDSYLTAPCDGVITVVYPNESELVMTGAPIMNLQKDDHFVVFNVRETLLKDISVGTKLKVRIPALDKHAELKVYFIRDLGTYANWQATKATGDFDARTFQIKARSEKPIEGLRPGMSVVLEP